LLPRAFRAERYVQAGRNGPDEAVFTGKSGASVPLAAQGIMDMNGKMHRRLACLVAGLGLVAGSAVVSGQPVGAAPRPRAPVAGEAMTADHAGPAERALLAAEDARFAAQIRQDAAAVSAGLADELTYVHAIGRRQSKAEYLAGFTAGRTGYRSLVPKDRVAGVSGNLGWTRALLAQQVGERTMSSSYLAIYVKRAGRWQLLSWQTTPNDAPSAPGPAGPPPSGK
jgi:hypothetical protein